MATKQPKYETLQDLLLLKLGSLLDIETQLVKALPKMAKAANEQKLRDAFIEHLEETEAHVERIEQAFENIDSVPKKMKVEAIRGLIEDADWIGKSAKNPAARDALLVAAAQCVEQYEIASYRSACAWARLIDRDEIADLLQQTLDEEEETNETLAELAENTINENVERGTQEE